MQGESLLARAVRVNPNRPLPIALAHAMASAKVSDQDRQQLLSRVFKAMQPAQQARCRHELAECRAARRGERFAVVS